MKLKNSSEIEKPETKASVFEAPETEVHEIKTTETEKLGFNTD